MSNEMHSVNYKVYWLTWLALLILTLVMIFIGSATMPRSVMVVSLLLAMMAKASLIGGYFMHLRFERASLVFAVAVGILVTAAFLFFLIAPDGVRILESSRP